MLFPSPLYFFAMRRLRTTLSAALVAGTLTLGGCNAFESFYSDASSDNAAALVTSAQNALQQGNAARAADLFGQALQSAPAGSEAQARAANGFATATFEHAGVSVLNFDRIASDLSARFDGGGQPSGTVPTGVCSFAAPERAGQEIRLDEIDGYPVLRASVAALAATRTALATAYGLPATPGPNYDGAALAARLRARGLSTNEASSALLNITLAYSATAFHRIAQAGGESIRWYEVIPPTGDSYIGYCAPSAAVEQQVRREASCSMGDIGFSIALLKGRNSLFAPGSLSGDLVTQAEDAYRRLSSEIGTTCN